MIKTLLELKRDVEELKRITSNLIRVGTVATSDPKRGYRVDFGPDPQGGSHLSPWLPHPDSGGEVKTFVPLTKGQIVGVISPVGDSEQGFIVRAGFKKGEDNPSEDPGLNRFVFGTVEITISSEKILFKVDGVSLELCCLQPEMALFQRPPSPKFKRALRERTRLRPLISSPSIQLLSWNLMQPSPFLFQGGPTLR